MRVLLLVLVACGSNSTNAPLVAWYPFDDLVAGRATDASGNGHHGACTSCPTVEAGKTGRAYRFNGGDQQIDVPANAAFATTSGLSAAAWVKLDASPPTIPGCAIVGGVAWQLCVTPQLQPAFGSFAASATLSLAAWHHIAITWDRTTQRIFLDGNEVGSQAGSVPSNNSVSLGPELIGLVDEPRIYAGVLDADEVAALAAP